MAGLDTQLDTALKAMEASFHVRLIGTFEGDLVWAPAEADAEAWLALNSPDFDQFPVGQPGHALGILIRDGNHASKTVGNAMQPLRDGMIVSADTPIAELIPQLRESHYRLILRGGRIDGLVTQSDMLKLPVRLVVFAFITHLEQVMAEVVAAHWPTDSWFGELSDNRQSQIIEKEEELRSRGMNPPRIELTEFGDKRNLCKKLLPEKKTLFQKEIEELRELRDQVVHAATFVEGTEGKLGVVAFVNRFEAARRWIDELTKLIPKDTVRK